MRILVDNALSPKFADALSAAGHDVIHVRTLGLASAADKDIFDLADREQRVLVSQDTDFGALLALRRSIGPSVVLFRCQDKRKESLLRAFIGNAESFEDDLKKGAVVVIEDTRIRIRKLPIEPGPD